MKEEQEDNSRLVEVFSGSGWETELVKGLLKSNHIEAVLKDGLMASIAPYISPSATVLVNEDDYKAAMQIIDSQKREKA